MPELPEVQTTVNGIKEVAVGKKITAVWTDYNSPFHSQKDNIKNPVFFKKFKNSVAGTKIIHAERRAKNVLIHLSNGQTILIHMKMTGHVMCGRYMFDKKKKKDPWTPIDTTGPLSDPFNKFIHFTLTLDSYDIKTKNSPRQHPVQLVLSDMRKFAKVTLIPTDKLSQSPDLAHLGPEPLDKAFTFDVYKERISKKSKGKIKTVLMDQTLIAGIGNIYSDEVLWRAGVNPEERVIHLSDKTLRTMFEAIKTTLRKGIDFGGDSMSDYRNIHGERGQFQAHHEAYRRTHKPCRKRGCGGMITRKIVGGRSAHFCTVHQRLHSQHAK